MHMSLSKWKPGENLGANSTAQVQNLTNLKYNLLMPLNEARSVCYPSAKGFHKGFTHTVSEVNCNVNCKVICKVNCNDHVSSADIVHQFKLFQGALCNVHCLKLSLCDIHLTRGFIKGLGTLANFPPVFLFIFADFIFVMKCSKRWRFHKWGKILATKKANWYILQVQRAIWLWGISRNALTHVRG